MLKTAPAGSRSVENTLAQVWAEVLGLPEVDSGLNFFDAGGDSMKAMDVISRVSEILRVDLPLLAFFEDPTIAHHAAVIEELMAEGTAAPLRRIEGRRKFPLSHPQEAFWLLEQQNPGTGVHNTARIFRIRGHIDAALLEKSLNELLRRHEILRVRFLLGEEGPYQVVGSPEPLQVETIDLSARETHEAETEARRVALETVRTPFNLETGPLLRARLVRLSSDESLLCIGLHHVVSDGYTGSLMLQEISVIYDAYAEGVSHRLPEPELHFTDFAAWERERMNGPRIEEDLVFWRRVLEGAPGALDVPTDFPRPSSLSRSGRLRSTVLPEDLLARLREFARGNGTTLFTVLAASLRILLSRWTGQTDFVLGTIASNRSQPGTERMIGCFVNSLALRNPVGEHQSARDVLMAEKNADMDAFAHQDCPFASIVVDLNRERTASDNPLFNVALMLQSFPSITTSSRHLSVEYVNFDAEVAIMDLRFIADERQDGLRVFCEYRDDLFREETIDLLLDAYGGVLKQSTDDPSIILADLVLPEKLTAQAAAARARDHAEIVTIAASFTGEPVGEPLNLLLNELEMPYRLVFAPNGQVIQQLLNPKSPLQGAGRFGIALVRVEDLLPRFSNTSDLAEVADQTASDLVVALNAAATSGASMILCFCPSSIEFLKKPGMAECVTRIESAVATQCANSGAACVVRSSEILDLYPVEEYEDPIADQLGKVPYTSDFFSALALMLARKMWRLSASRYKVIVIDPEQVLGDGDLQRTLLAQRDGGMLLCLSAAAPEEDVWEAFESNPAMLIGRDDFVAGAFQVTSEPQALRDLAKKLGLGLDRFALLHSDGAVCEAVQAECPEVLTIQSPAETSEMESWLRNVWLFDRIAGVQ